MAKQLFGPPSKAPLERGAAARRFSTIGELTQATDCPLEDLIKNCHSNCKYFTTSRVENVDGTVRRVVCFCGHMRRDDGTPAQIGQVWPKKGGRNG